MLPAGTLKCRVVIERPSAQQDAAGQPLNQWTKVCKPRASIRHAAGLEAVRASAESSIDKASFRIRYRTGIDTSMRVVYRGQVYSISAILPDEVERDHIDLVCEVINGRV